MCLTHIRGLTPSKIKAGDKTTIVYQIISRRTGVKTYSMDCEYTQLRQSRGDKVKALVFKPIRYGVML